MEYDKLMYSITNEAADDSIVDTALADALQNSDDDLSDPSTTIMTANENDDVPDEYDDPVTQDDLEIVADNIADIPEDAEIPDYDDVDIAMASDTEEDSYVVDTDFDEDPEGIEVFYNSDFKSDDDIDLDEAAINKYTPAWVIKLEESLHRADAAVEALRESRLNIIAKANNIDQLLELDRVGII